MPVTDTLVPFQPAGYPAMEDGAKLWAVDNYNGASNSVAVIIETMQRLEAATAPLAHTHVIADVTGLASALATHTADISTLVASVAAKLPLAGGTLTGRVEQSTTGFQLAQKDDITTRTDSGWWQTDTGTTAEGWPLNNTNWQHLYTSTHTNGANYFSFQLSADFFSQRFFARSTNNNGSQGWSELWHSNNLAQFSSVAVGYVPASGGGTTNFLRADGSWAAPPAAGGLTLITTSSFPGATTWTLTGLGGYKALWVSVRNIGQSSGSSKVLQLEMSGNGGSTWGGLKLPFGATSLVSGGKYVSNFWITRTDQTNNQMVFLGSFVRADSGGTATNDQIDVSSRGPIDAIRLSWAAGGSFDSGEVDVYGFK